MPLEDVGVRAVVQGMGPYERNAMKVQKAQQRMGESAVKAAKQSGFLSKALGQVASTAGGFLVARGVMMIPQVLGGILSTSRDLELQMKKANIVFGDQIDVVNEWAKANAKAMGLSAAAAKNLAARFGDILIPMGFARNVAADMSTKVVGLAGALSEWSGGTRSAAEVADILAKAMTGEREALKGLGVVITEADITTRMLAKGFVDLAGAQLQQARATVTQELIFEKSTDAQTAYAEGAGSAARKQAELAAEMAEAKEVISLALTPALLAVTGLVADKLVPGLQAAATGIGKFIDIAGAMAVRIKENKDLLVAFATVSLAAVLIPTIVNAVTALWQLHEVFQALAAARHISLLEAGIRSLTLPTIGLPALAIGAVAAGLAIFGLARHFLRGREAANAFKKAQEKLNEEMEEIERIARLTGVDAGAAKLQALASTALAAKQDLADLTAEFDAQLVAIGAAASVSDAFTTNTWEAVTAAAALKDRVADLTTTQEANLELLLDQDASMAKWIGTAEALGIPLSTLAELSPKLAEAFATLGGPLEDLDASVPVVTEKLEDQTKAVKDLAEALEDKLARALRSLVTPTTQEEVQLRAVISGLQAQQSEIRGTAALLDRTLTPAEEAYITVLGEEEARFGDILTAVEDAKDAEGDRVFALAGHFPTYRETNALAGGLAEMLDDVDIQGKRAQDRMAQIATAVDAVADAGTPLNDFLRDTLIPTFVDTAASALRMWAALDRGNLPPPGVSIGPKPPGLPGIRAYQHGGMVAGPVGQPVLGLLHGGERVTPAAAVNGGQPVSVVVHAPISMGEQTDWLGMRRVVHEEVDAALDEAESQALRSGAPTPTEIG